MGAIATDGAFECLRSGITTVGDCSFAGAAADAAALTGLRAIVYLEVFGRDASALDRFHELRERVGASGAPTAFGSASRRTRRTPARSELYEACAALGLPKATHLAESVAEREFLVDGIGGLVGVRAHARAAPGSHGDPPARRAPGCSARALMAAHCVHVDDEEIALLAEHGVGVAHCPRSNGILGCGVAPLAELRDAGIAVGHRDRQPRVDAVVRPVRRAAHGDRRRARARTTARRAERRATRSSSRRSAARACSGWTTRSARSSPASRPTWPSSPSTARRSSLLKILLRPWSWAARRIGLQLLS